MIKRLISAAVAVAMAAQAWAGVGVWSGQGPDGGYIYDLLQSPSDTATLYASTRSGVFKSTDSGATWSPMMHGIVGSVGYGYPVAIDADAANTLYVVDSTGHLYRSTDGAATWVQTGYVLPPVAGASAITKIIDAPGSSTRLYLTTVSGVLVSNDSGATFSALNGTGANVLPSGVPFQWLSVDPSNANNLLVGTQAYDAGAGPDVPCIYRSTDGGANWLPVLTVPQGGESYYPGITDISFGHGSEVYAAVDMTLYSSPDGGASWSAVAIGTPSVAYYVTTLKADPSVAGGLYAGGYFGVLKSSDGGQTFNVVVADKTNGFSPNAGADVATAQRLAFSGSTFWLASQEAGLFISTDGGSHWNGSNTGIDATNIRALGLVPAGAGNPPRILAGYGDAFRPSPGIYAGIDAGDGNVSWANSDNGLRAYQIRAITVDPTTTGAVASTVVYAGGRSEQVVAIAPRNGGVYKSTDGGSSWTTIDAGLPLRQPTSSPAPFVGTVRSIVLDPHSCTGYPTCTGPEQTVYATSNGCYVYTAPNPSSPPPPPSLVGYCGSILNTHYLGSYQFRIFKSTTAGMPPVPGSPAWTSSDNGIPQSFIGTSPNYSDFESLLVVPLAIDPSNPQILYAGTSDQFDATQVTHPTLLTGVYKSTDGGANWTQSSSGLPTYPGSPTNLGVLALAIDPLVPSTLWAAVIDINAAYGAPGHIYKSTDSGATWTDSSAGLTSADIRALLVDHPSLASPAVVYAAGGGTSGNPGGVFKSYDAGATWHSESIGLPADAALALTLDKSGATPKLYAGTSSGVWEITETLDTDHDGVSDIQENLGPNGGDSNLDGIADRTQPDVTYVPPHTSARPAPGAPPQNNDFAVQVASQNSGTTCTQTQDVQAKSAAANGPDPIANNLAYRYDMDLLQFEILNCAATTVKVTYPNYTFGKGWTFRFYGPATPGDDSSIKYYDFSSKATLLDAHTWQLNLTRGQFGSYRPDSTGSILFQGGPAFSDRIFGNGFN